MRTRAGVLVFNVVVDPSGGVTDVRLVREVDAVHPWPALAERWRSAIMEWRYQPASVKEMPLAVCVTVSVNVHVE